MKVWLCENEQARWFEFEEPHDMPSDVTVTMLTEKFTGIHEQRFHSPNPPLYSGGYVEGVMAERQRIVNLLMIQHEAAKDSHNYWQVAANLIQADVASDT